jgi:hypothetical protein
MSDDIIRSASAGFTDSILDKVTNYLKKFKNRELAFIQDPETIDMAIECNDRGEYKEFQKLVPETNYSMPFKLGLVLRSKEKNGEDYSKLKDKIKRKYNQEGLDIAYFSQNELFSKVKGIITEKANTEDEIKLIFRKFIVNIEKNCFFITNHDNIEAVSNKIQTIILSKLFQVYILSGCNRTAKKNISEIFKKIKPYVLNDYEYQIINSKSKKIILFSKKKFI